MTSRLPVGYQVPSYEVEVDFFNGFLLTSYKIFRRSHSKLSLDSSADNPHRPENNMNYTVSYQMLIMTTALKWLYFPDNQLVEND